MNDRVWLAFTYGQAAPFNLRLSVATTTASVTSLVPTPACFKLALVDAAFRLSDPSATPRRLFDALRGREVRVGVPKAIVVQKTFARRLVPWESKGKGETRAAAVAEAISEQNYPFKRTIAFLELAYWSSPICIAIDVTSIAAAEREQIHRLATCVGYLGRRGSFVHLRSRRELAGDAVLPKSGFAVREEHLHESQWPTDFVSRPTDDFTTEAEFGRVSIATEEKVRVTGVDRDRIVGTRWLLPMRQVRGSRKFSVFERATGGGLAWDGE